MINIFKKENQEEPKTNEELFSYIKKLEGNIKQMTAEIESLKRKNKLSVQNIGIIRYNPFKEVGGDQSFSIALLDGENDGIVVTSLFSRDGNRIYGKPIKKGSSPYSLSDEERKAIEEAKKNK